MSKSQPNRSNPSENVKFTKTTPTTAAPATTKTVIPNTAATKSATPANPTFRTTKPKTARHGTSKSKKSKLSLARKKAQRKKITIVALILAVSVAAVIILVLWLNPGKAVPLFKTGSVQNFATVPAMTEGEADANQHFVEYTDLFCPYCSKFGLAVLDNQSEFETKYLLPKKIYFELRVTDLLSSSDHNPSNSHNSALVGYCVAEQEKFWEYYQNLLRKIKTEYYDKGIGNEHGAPPIEELGLAYFFDLATSAGADENNLQECLKSNRPETLLANANAKALSETNGSLPYFLFGEYVSSGFNSGWETVKQMFAAGGVPEQ